jgi:hypothetical protein
MRITSRQKLLITVILLSVISIVLKVLVAGLGGNNDLASWWDNARLMSLHGVLYAYTPFYNYGPIWAYMLWFLRIVLSHQNALDITNFHIWLVVFLSLVDCGISFYIWKIYGKIPAIIFLINPISVLITGFHTQFDNFAIFVGLAGWWYYLLSQSKKGKASDINYLLAAVLLGISLSLKHVLLFFPFWILMIPDKQKRNIYYKLAFFALIYLIFFGGFAFEVLRNWDIRHQVWSGIIANVFKYNSSYGHSFTLSIIRLFFPPELLGNLFAWSPFFSRFKFIYLVVVLLYGFFAVKKFKDIKLLYPLYLLVFFAFSPNLTDQYEAIPLLAMAVFYNNWAALLYFVTSFIYLAGGSSANIAFFQVYPMKLGFGPFTLPFFPWSMGFKFIDFNTQAWASVLALYIMFTNVAKISPRSFFATNVFKVISAKKMEIYFAVFFIMLVSLCIFIYMRYDAQIFYNRVRIVSATYGKNCSTLKRPVHFGNVTKKVASDCNGQIGWCSHPVNFSDVAEGCQKDYRISWTCSSNRLIYPVYFLNSADNVEGTTVKISCPIY